MKIKFNDGMQLDTSGEHLSLTRKHDGYYVVGRRMSIPVDSWDEGMKIIKDMEPNNPIFSK